MKRYLRRMIGVALVALVAVVGVAMAGEPVRITEASFEPRSVMLGDHFELVVTVDGEEDYEVAFPDLEAGIADGKIELLEDCEVESEAREEGFRLRKRYRLICFEPAQYRIDSLAVLCGGREGVDTLYAPGALELEVQLMPVDTAQKTIYDIKQPLDAPLLLEEFGGYGVSLIFLCAVVASLVYYVARAIRRRRHPEREAEALPKEAPHIVAIRSLVLLSGQKLWQNGKYKEYYTRLTDILRVYLDGRFGVAAMEMTSDQIAESLAELELRAGECEKLVDLLRESDLVKFAKHQPTAETNEAAYYTVYYFVENSKEVAEQVVDVDSQEIEGVVTEEKEEGER